ncbi:MAG TPA: NADH-quinone oxidoreductase subunit NuoE [Symbiobacteriaceae bacterium]|nr:NADH-quinone oxidoreductase subunit NuoE [Symbiobacteriaceae bacterium]
MSLLLLKPGAPEPTEKLAALEAFMNEQGRTPALVIPALQQAQALFGYVPKEAMALVASSLGVPFARVYGVATFYAQFRLQPAGRRTVRVCMGTACHVRGARAVLDAWAEALGVKPGGTTKDGEVTLEQVSCLGACGLAPTVMVDATTHGRLSPGKVKQVLKEMKA